MGSGRRPNTALEVLFSQHTERDLELLSAAKADVLSRYAAPVRDETRAVPSGPDLRTQSLCEPHRHLDLDSADRHAFDVDAERDAEIAAIGDDVRRCG